MPPHHLEYRATAQAERHPWHASSASGSAIAIVVGSMIGSGIFRVPSATLAQAGTPGGMMLVWVVGGVVALCGALTLAELAAHLPASRRDLRLPQRGLRAAAGLPGRLAVAGDRARLDRRRRPGLRRVPRRDSSRRSHDHDPAGRRRRGGVGRRLELPLGPRSAPRFRTSRRPPRCSPSSALTAAAFLSASAGGGRGGRARRAWLPTSWAGFGLGLVTVLWAYNGWQDATYVGGEIKDPGRNLPRALIVGTLLVTAVYLARQRGLPRGAADGGDRALAAGGGRRGGADLFGEVGNALIAALVCVSTFGTMNSGTMCYPRIFYAMAEDRLFFREDRGGPPAVRHAPRVDRADRGARRSAISGSGPSSS